MTGPIDDDYVAFLNRNFEPRNDVAEGIAARDRKIREIDGLIAEAKEKRVGDPWHWDQKLTHLGRLRQAEVLQRASLEFRQRNERTADDSQDSAAFSSGAVWRNDQG